MRTFEISNEVKIFVSTLKESLQTVSIPFSFFIVNNSIRLVNPSIEFKREVNINLSKYSSIIDTRCSGIANKIIDISKQGCLHVTDPYCNLSYYVKYHSIEDFGKHHKLVLYNNKFSALIPIDFLIIEL